MQEKIYVRAVLVFIVVLIIANIYTWYPRIVGEKQENTTELIPVTVNSPSLLNDRLYCERGQLQSPIDISANNIQTDQKKNVQFDYQPTTLKISNGSKTIHASVTEENLVKMNEEEYNLVDIHFHYPSEHTINGKYFDLEMHLVHENEDGEKLVVAALFEEGKQNEIISYLFSGLPYKQENLVEKPVDLSKFIQNQKAYNYIGSLTTPPCTEGVEWVVLDEIYELSDEQLAVYRKKFPQNNRPIQQLNNRQVRQITISEEF